jgi:hypothetical protein
LLVEKQRDNENRCLFQQRQEEIYRFYDRYKVVSQMSKEGLWEMHVPGKFAPQTPVWYSDEFIRILGYNKQDFPPILQTFVNIVEPSHRERFLSERTNFFKGLYPDDKWFYTFLYVSAPLNAQKTYKQIF